MLWFPFILTLLCGVIVCGSHLMDNRLRSQYSASQPAVSMTAAVSSSNTAEHYKTRDSNLFRALSGYFEDTNDLGGSSENGKNKKRNFANSNELSHNTIFSDIITLDAPPAIMHFPATANENVGSTTELDAIAETSMPASYFDEYNEDGTSGDGRDEIEKRAGSPPIGCDCKLNNDLLDLGQQHFPRYLLNAVCQTDAANEYPLKCRRGTHCKPLEYKVKVLTFRNMLDHTQKDPALAWLPDDLRQLWKFKTVTVAAGCFYGIYSIKLSSCNKRNWASTMTGSKIASCSHNYSIIV